MDRLLIATNNGKSYCLARQLGIFYAIEIRRRPIPYRLEMDLDFKRRGIKSAMPTLGPIAFAQNT
jgi:hypothetical protein